MSSAYAHRLDTESVLNHAMDCLHIEDVGNDLIEPVRFEVSPGECVVISGASGTGKSLLLRAIADLDLHSGHARLGSEACEAIPAQQWRKRVGLLAAESAWWAETVSEHIPEMDEHYLDALGFKLEVGDWAVARLSTGEKQRLALLRLLANQPEFLLLDEPTANLDPDSVSRVEDLLLTYCRKKPAGLIWVSHDPGQIKRIADRHFSLTQAGLVEVDQ